MSKDLIVSLKEALRVSPDNLPLRQTLADLLLNEKIFTEAEGEYKFILSRQPGSIEARTGLAKTYFELGKYSTALIILEELVNDKPNDFQLLLLISRAFLRNEERAKAREYYQKALELNPAFTDDELDELRKSSSSSLADEIVAGMEAEFERVEKPKIRFEDVGGMAKVKDEIRIKIIQPLQHPELYKAYGKKIGGGILLYGPPGCGKTHLARATAGEINASFISVGIHDVLDTWIGNSEKKLHDIFELARHQTPCVLFFDEIDALGASRSDMRQSASKMLINQFLTELDGIQSSNEGLLVLGATNAPWHLDSAFRRPGRFDRIIFVQPPDTEGREAILQLLLKDKPLGKVDFSTIAKQTLNFSGADLKGLVDLAIEYKLRESFSKGTPQPIHTKDLLEPLSQMKASTKDWFNTARNYALYANDSGLYDEILEYLKIKK